ncbi:MAG: beta-1,6-N-acetylglucosaminyltransferase [Bryobacteraceae bacterium]
MNIAYLVFAYKHPQLLRRSTAALSSPHSSFFVHIDLKSDIEEFSAIAGPNIHFAPRRIPVYWAEFSGVRAIVGLMRQALETMPSVDYVVLLSGSEYPLHGSAYIHDFFHTNRGQEFINMVRVPHEPAGKPLARINTWRLESTHPAGRWATRVLGKFGLDQRDYRKHLRGWEPFAGNTWWALTADACRHVLKTVDEKPFLEEFFRESFAPEESFIHTILGNSPFRTNVRRNLLYEDWSLRLAHPAMINEQHLAYFEEQGRVRVEDCYGSGEVLFARKLDDSSLDLVDRLDRRAAIGIGQS